MIEIGSFQIDRAMRTLRRNGRLVHLGSRAFDILVMIAAADGRLVTKEELLKAVWPHTFVEENSLHVALSALRKVLGPERGLIVNVPGLGYQLRKQTPGTRNAETAGRAPAVSRLATSTAGLLGRAAQVQSIRAMIQHVHVLTLVGAGGIGKTSLALEAARCAAADFPEAVCLVELAALTAGDSVLDAIAEALGLAIAGPPFEVAQVAAALGRKRRLLVLDNAEHVICDAAHTVDALVAYDDNLRVLVTSREPLRIMLETVFRVEPLDVPPAGASDAQILACPAVDLFLLRANSLQAEVSRDSATIQLAGEICRRLDGIPLAIELAAARVFALGVEGVHRLLDDRMTMLGGGYRNVLPRHLTLRATFDWSFAILDKPTQLIFRRLAVFSGSFNFEALCAVVCDEAYSVMDAINGITELVAKSLVSVEFIGSVARYRMSESTRAYASEKLRAEGEYQPIALRHARYLSNCFEVRASGEPDGGGSPQPSQQQTLDEARNACDWAFSSHGDARVGVELASNLVNVLLEAGLIDECCTRAARAADALDALPSGSVDAACEMRLRAALASALPYGRGQVARQAELWQTVLSLAIRHGDTSFEARALWGLWNTTFSSGDVNGSLVFAGQFRQLAGQRGTPWQKVLGDQLMALSQHLRGEHATAKRALQSVRRRFAQLQREARQEGSFAVDPEVFCSGTLARIAWLEGDPRKAMELVDSVVNLVRPQTMEPSLTHVLGAAAIPLALLCGDVRRGEHYIEIMRSQAALHGFVVWQDYCDCLCASRDIGAGRTEHALPLLETKLDALISRGFRRVITPLIVALAEALIAQGRLHDASNRLNDAHSFCERYGDLLFLPELWRMRGIAAQAEAARHDNGSGSEAFRRAIAYAHSCFSQAIELARDQGAVMWSLRASMSMARLLDTQGRTSEAVALLERLAPQLAKASGTPDVQAWVQLTDVLRARRTQTPQAARDEGPHALHSVAR